MVPEPAAGPPAYLVNEDGTLYIHSKEAISAQAVARSPMLQSLSETPGQAAGLPFSRNAFEAWIQRVLAGPRDAATVGDILCHLKVCCWPSQAGASVNAYEQAKVVIMIGACANSADDCFF